MSEPEFNFDAAIKTADVDTRCAELECVILGPSGAGKSFALGSLKVPTLYLYASGETHGVKAARVKGAGNVTPYCFDRDPKSGDKLEADAALAQLLAVLQAQFWIKGKGFQAVVIDGLSEMEFLIRSCGLFQKKTTKANGVKDGYADSPATLEIFRPFITALQDLRRSLGIHYVVTCIADVKEMASSGEYMEASAALRGYQVAAGLIQQFHDVLIVGKMENPKTQKISYRFQFNTDLTKTSKEANGAIKRTINFSPRINGLTAEELPPHMEADLSMVIDMKRKKLSTLVSA